MPPPDPKELADQLRHLRELPRAQPPPDLLGRIEAGIRTARVITLREWRRFAVAAAVLVALNVSAILYYSARTTSTYASDTTSDTTLISDYELYE